MHEMTLPNTTLAQRYAPGTARAYADDVILLNERWPDICLAVSTGLTLRQALRQALPHPANGRWDFLIAETLRQNQDMADDLAEAESKGARWMAQSVVDIADDLVNDDSADPVKVAKLRIEARKWVASQHNQDRYGVRQPAQTVVQVDARSLHLQALQSVPDPVNSALPAGGQRPIDVLPRSHVLEQRLPAGISSDDREQED